MLEVLYKHIRYWDSDLVFTSNIEDEVKEVLEIVNDKFSYNPIFGNVEVDLVALSKYDFPDSNAYHWRKDGVTDYTCAAKGFFINKVVERVKDKKFLINFGGDLYTNDRTLVKAENAKMQIQLLNGGSVFCSTNFRRPGHIPDAVWDTVYVVHGEGANIECIWYDIQATECLCNDLMASDILYINKNGLVANKTYIASPFFNSLDTMIRDAMVERFFDPIRPDLLNPNIEGDLHKDKKLADKIRQDNLDAIDSCSLLVFPKDTTDLGTLFEVGYALRKGKMILRYDYRKDLYELIVGVKIPEFKVDPQEIVLDLNKLGAGVILGYYYDLKLKYYLGESKDNIMLNDNPEVDKPTELYPSYCVDLLSETVYHLNTLTSGS